MDHHASVATSSHEVLNRVRAKMRTWGITGTYLAVQLGVSRQYIWQITRGSTRISNTRAAAIERVVDHIIAQEEHMRSFGARLRAARIASGLTLKEVATLIGYSWVGVERWEQDRCKPKPGVLWHLFTLYGIPVTPRASLSIHPEMPLPSANAE